MTIVLDGSSLTIEKLVAIARDNEKVELAPEALERIKVCRAMLEKKLANKEIMYGTNTGIGEFSEKVLNDDQVKEFQRYLVYNHAAGIGEPAPIEYVRAALDYHLSYRDLKQLARTGMEHNFLPGASLWAEPDLFTAPAAACKGQTPGADKHVAACKTYLDGSEKATAQWELERRFRAFEAKF